jgi:hypothetical protein
VKSRTKSQRRPRGRSGGRAGGSGYDLQDRYVAHQLAKLLVGDREPLVEVLWEKKSLDLGGGHNVETIHVDDAILRLAGGRCVFVQVKEASPAGGWTARELIRSSVAQQFWAQWNSRPPAERSRTALRLAARGDVTTLELMADAALRSATPAELFADEASAEITNEIAALAAGLNLASDDTNFLAFLKCIQAEPLLAATDLETRTVQSLALFGDLAQGLARRLVSFVSGSKHPGSDARAAFSKDTLATALIDDGFPEASLIAIGVRRAKPVDDAVWDRYRELIIRKFRSFRVYGLQVDRAVYADLPALFIPLRLAPIPTGRARGAHNGPGGNTRRSLAERLSEEAEQTRERENLDDQLSPSQKGEELDLHSVLLDKRRFAIVGGPGAGKTTTLKWLAIASTLPGEDGRRLRAEFGLPPEPLIPIYVRFRQFAERIRARGLVGVEGRAGLVADFLTAEFEAGLAGDIPDRQRALEMAQHLLDSERSLFLFDGLDEVADEGMRSRLFEAVADLMEKYGSPRIIVTSRPYAFRRDRAPLELALFEPLPLDRDDRRIFARQWYRAVRTTGAAPLEEDEARLRAEDLARAADSMPDLSEIPLLLSILALVHFNRQGLPVERAMLYDHATLAMLGHWERDPSGRDLGDDAVPSDWARRLQLDEKDIRCVVEHVAWRVQVQGGGGEFGRDEALVSLGEGLDLLPAGRNTAHADRAELLLTLLSDRAGLLQERSPNVFAFVHLSFQEYLTARRFVGLGEPGLRELAQLAGNDRQAEVCRLAAGILSADQRAEADERATAFILSVAPSSPALATACLLEAPGVRLEKGFAEQLAMGAFRECSNPRTHYYPPDVTARLVWAALKFTSDYDRVLLRILSDPVSRFDQERFFGRRMKRGFRDRHFREMSHYEGRHNPTLSVIAARPCGPIADKLGWVFHRLASTRREEGGGLLRSLAELMLIEAGEIPARDHVPALLELLAEDAEDRRRWAHQTLLHQRADRLLEQLWLSAETLVAIRSIILGLLTLNDTKARERGSDLAWTAAKFLIARHEWDAPRLANAIIETGLPNSAHRKEALSFLKTLASQENARTATLNALTDGLALSDGDARTACFRILLDLNALPPRAAGLAEDAEFLSEKMLSDPATAGETILAVSEDLWSDSPATAWRAAKALIASGNAATPGVLQAVVNAGFVFARPEAMAQLRQFNAEARLSALVRGALLGGITSSDAHVAAASGLLLLELGPVDNQRLLKRVIKAVLRDPDQIDGALPSLVGLIRGSQFSNTVLEILGEALDAKPDRRVASAIARMLGREGLFHVRNLAAALIQYGLYSEADHKEVVPHIQAMLDDQDLAPATWRQLFEALSATEGEVDWGAANSLWEAGRRTDPRIAKVFADPGLAKAPYRERSRTLLLQLFTRPKTAGAARQALEEAINSAISVPRGHSRELDWAWAIAECLIAAKAFHADDLAKATVLGGLHRRSDHATTMKVLADCIAQSPEFATKIEGALWEALDDENTDIQWGAARALIENGFWQAAPQPTAEIDEEDWNHASARNQEERLNILSRLWKISIREAASEPLAATTLGRLCSQITRNAPERRALRKLLEQNDPEAACAAAHRLADAFDEDLLPAVAVLVKKGLSDRDRRPEAARRLDALLGRVDTAPIVVDALNRALWDDDAEVAWSSALFLEVRGHAVNLGLLRAFVYGGLLGYRQREAEARLRRFLADPSTRQASLDALTVGMFSEHEETTDAVACLLVEAGAPMESRIINSLDAMVPLQPWIPLALLALTNRKHDAVKAAAQFGCEDLLELLGSA